MRPREDRQQRGSALLQACPAASTGLQNVISRAEAVVGWRR